MPDALAPSGAAYVEQWLERFDASIARSDARSLAELFQADSHWRDLLALGWFFDTVSGGSAIAAQLGRRAGRDNARAFALDRARTPPRQVTRMGLSVLEALFKFETDIGRCNGVIRLRADETGMLKGWTLLTALDVLKGHEETIGKARPTGVAYSRNLRGPNWLDQRRATAAYEDQDPAVLVIGGGQAGVATAARLTQLQVDTLIVDREARIGDNWRKRYHALALHNQVQVIHFPYMPFPPNWPTYVPKDKLAGWFESYVEAMELNFWTGTEFLGGDYDESAGCWTVKLRRADGTVRTMRPRHVVMATGVSGAPNLPDIATLDRFAGKRMHSGEYQDGEAWQGRNAIVIGTGTSGHDIAQDLHVSGAKVSLVQRSPSLVLSIEPSGQLAYTLYDEGLPLDDCDLIAASMPFSLARTVHTQLTDRARQIDRTLHEGLERRGFRLDFGPDGTGWQFNYLTRGGGYYFNVGCSDLIIDGSIRLVQYADIEGFDADGARLAGGEKLPADLIVLATGYKGPTDRVRTLFGERIANRVGPIWGFGDEKELRNMYTRTPQPGLWFIAGGLAQTRIYSKYLTLQIKACEVGLLAPKL